MKMSASSYADAISFLNIAYNPNAASSYFPQPLQPIADSSPSVTTALATATSTAPPESINVNNSSRLPTVALLGKKSAEVFRCEICSINCNSIMMLDKHMLGKKHRTKTKEFNPDSLMLDGMRTECIEGAKAKSVKYVDSDALPGIKEVCATSGTSFGTQTVFHQPVSAKEHAFVVESQDRDTMMLKPSSNYSPDVPGSHVPKHQELSTDDTCNGKEGDDEIMADKRQLAELEAGSSADIMLHASNVEAEHRDDLGRLDCASRTAGRFCTVCSIFSNSQVAFEKHVAGKTHARKLKYLGTVMSSPVSVCPVELLESGTLKLARDARSPADPPSVVPVGCTGINETIHSEGGTAVRSPNVCSLCNVECNSQELFKGHLSGRKHAAKVRRSSSSIQIPNLSRKDHDASRKLPLVQFQEHDPNPDPDVNVNDASGRSSMVLQDNNSSDKSICSINSYATSTIMPTIPPKDGGSLGQLYVCSESNGTNEAPIQYLKSETTRRDSKRGKIVQFAYCDVCKVYCNSSEILHAHIMGTRHVKQLEKLGKIEKGTRTHAKDVIASRTDDSMAYQDSGKSSVSKPSMVAVNQGEAQKGVIISQNRNSTQETSQDANFGCTLCKVVCNSQTTFTAHLAGSRHTAMLQKTAVTEIVDPGP